MAVDTNNLGSFSDINAVWARYPEGGHEGDYLTIAGVKHRWNKYHRIWESSSMVTATRARRVDTVGGDLHVNNDTVIGDELLVRGNSRFEGDVTVEGMLYAKKVKQPNKGFFQNEEALTNRYPSPEVGWWATVGDVMPGTVYRCESEGIWTNTGNTGGVDIEEISYQIVNSLDSIDEKKALSAAMGKLLYSIIDSGYMFGGLLTPNNITPSPECKTAYLAKKGKYLGYGSDYTVLSGDLGLFLFKNGNWEKRSIEITNMESQYIPEEQLSISDKEGNSIIDIIEGGRIRTKDMDSKYVPRVGFSMESDLSITDEKGNVILEVLNGGEIRTKKFHSLELTPRLCLDDLAFTDSYGNVVLKVNNGHIYTSKFDSSKISNSYPADTLILPENSIPLYITCNDLNKNNGWGIGSRNKSLSIWLDHFFHTEEEIGIRFDDGRVYHTFTQSIEHYPSSKWNNGVTKNEQIVNLKAGKDEFSVKLRSILNSATKDIKPIVLQIGDSVTEGWFANYPIVSDQPIQSWSWAKFYFEKDKMQKGGGFDSLFVGSRTNNAVSYDGVSYKCYAYGWGGKTARWFCTGADSPFSNNGEFSLTAYIRKYKTLADDGTTRLIPGSTAGTEVTDATAWDLCTPNIVVVQLGMNDSLSDWKNFMPQIINSIKTEYPSMRIIISVLDACTCNYPSLYPEYTGIFFDNYNNNHTKLLSAYSYAIDNWQDEDNGVYVIYSGAVMPMPYTCNVRETEGSFDGKNKRYIGVDSIERVPHPSRYAHQEIGYLLYSTIKWILTN